MTTGIDVSHVMWKQTKYYFNKQLEPDCLFKKIEIGAHTFQNNVFKKATT